VLAVLSVVRGAEGRDVHHSAFRGGLLAEGITYSRAHVRIPLSDQLAELMSSLNGGGHASLHDGLRLLSTSLRQPHWVLRADLVRLQRELSPQWTPPLLWHIPLSRYSIPESDRRLKSKADLKQCSSQRSECARNRPGP